MARRILRAIRKGGDDYAARCSPSDRIRVGGSDWTGQVPRQHEHAIPEIKKWPGEFSGPFAKEVMTMQRGAHPQIGSGSADRTGRVRYLASTSTPSLKSRNGPENSPGHSQRR